MGCTTSDLNEYKYNLFIIRRYLWTLPLWRRILARFFEKYKVTKKEYDDWFDKQISAPTP